MPICLKDYFTTFSWACIIKSTIIELLRVFLLPTTMPKADEEAKIMERWCGVGPSTMYRRAGIGAQETIRPQFAFIKHGIGVTKEAFQNSAVCIIYTTCMKQRILLSVSLNPSMDVINLILFIKIVSPECRNKEHGASYNKVPSPQPPTGNHRSRR